MKKIAQYETLHDIYIKEIFKQNIHSCGEET